MIRITARKVDLVIAPHGARGPRFQALDIDLHEAQRIKQELIDKVLTACFDMGLEQYDPMAQQPISHPIHLKKRSVA